MVADRVDQSVLDEVVRLRTPWLTDTVIAVTHLGDTVVAFVLTAAVAVALLARRRTDLAIMVAGAMTSGVLLMSGLKLVFGRERPPFPQRVVEEASHSFPSGHAMMSAILVCVVGAAVVAVTGSRSPLLVAALGLWTLVIGLSRVYLAAHWFTDVLAGWVLGFLWAGLWIVVTTRVRRGNSGDSDARPRRTL